MSIRRIFGALAICSLVSGVFAQEQMYTAVKHDLEWEGKKVSGSHNGKVGLSKGWLKKDGDKIVDGWFEVDLKTMTCEDLKAPEWNKKLIDHLFSDDFFSVESHPMATLKVNEAIPKAGDKWVFNTDLTIKGITHPLIFEAELETKDGNLEFDADLVIDRTKYEIRYGSGSFFKGLGDKLIYDNFEVDMEVVLAADSSPETKVETE